MRPLILSAIILSLAACRTDPSKPDTDTLSGDTGPELVDADGDGWLSDEDCDDDDASVHPGADEVCDELDNDCDGAIDEEAVDASTFYTDADGDGFGDPDAAVLACEAGDGLVEDATDCDDDNAETYPDAPERCDGLDNDCDGEIDEELQELWYADADGDGWGDATTTVESCDPGSGWVEIEGDCDDANSAIHPDAEEVCDALDNDCDGAVDEDLDTPWYTDADGDGYGDPDTEELACQPGSQQVADGTDCDDSNSAINPAGTEICNELDDDCDGLIDDEDDSVVGASTWYADVDGDGYGDDAVTSTACAQPESTSAYGGDCDDSDAAYNPGAVEDCTDPTDYNCDGSTGYADADGDGFAACEDCNDADATVNPEAEELCDGRDNNCDGTVDEDAAVDATTWYADADGDGYGDPEATAAACSQPSGYVSATYATDCDDSDPDISPVDPEYCDGVDNDCDGDIDEGVTSTFYADSDGDGYGDAATTGEACDASSGWVADDTDCDDSDAAVNPAATELCNGVDDDCDGLLDEADAADALTWYRDADGDGYGNAAASTVSCEEPTGFTDDATDCDDGDDDIHPGADELCDGLDQDCDGDIDEEAVDADTWYADADSDGYGDAGSTTEACSQPTGYLADDTDCDDGDAAVNPAASEICNGIDDDCDGYIDDEDPDVTGTSTWYIDYDDDGYGASGFDVDACEQPSGYVADNTDCDDAEAAAYPGADELCDGIDNDCDGDIDEAGALDEPTWYADADGDGFGDAGSTVVSCEQPTGYTDDDTDCDDGDDAVYPGAPEDCTEAIDYNCDGSTGYADLDGDGWAACEDCDDTDPTANPDGTEVCDGADNDCDGLVDDDDPGVSGAPTWYVDADGDGYGGSRITTTACEQPSGFVDNASDCDDGDDASFPGGTEVCDGADNDCDGTVDEAAAVDAPTWYADVDGDGYGDALSFTVACEQPTGSVADNSDCDDGEAAINPGAAEDCTSATDYDCDGDSGYADADGDGWAACEDCDDSDASANPDGTEVCDGVDNDCDGLVDDDDPGVTGAPTWYVDGDGDGYGGSRISTTACTAPSGYVDNASDCDDGDDAAFPGGIEVCDGADNDCDGTVDEADAVGAPTWYADADGDGYGDPSSSSVACDQPTGSVSDHSDCDDGDAGINPGAAEDCTSAIDHDCDGDSGYADADGDGFAACEDCDDSDAGANPDATEVCDGVDNDCDGLVDDDDPDVDGAPTWYVDADDDGYGGPRISTTACTQPSGFVDNHGDCDDGDDSAFPGGTEVCDGADNDCDGTVDEADATGAPTWYTDADGDGYGDAGSGTVACEQPTGSVADSSDCDDTDASINPGAVEDCADPVDRNCDGSTGYADVDGDGWAACEDCDDNDAGANPDATEVCDGVDNDCDGLVDDDDPGVSGTSTWYVDGDGDGFGGPGISTDACSQPSGFVDNPDDCDDGDDSAFPGGTEVCDRADNDCDGTVDEADATDAPTWYGDADGDGYGDAGSSTVACEQPTGTVADSSDCDDGDAAVNPGAAEDCTSATDYDCDGDPGYADADGDGWAACEDCDDSDAGVNPDGTEVCDGVDNDCDGLVDDDDPGVTGATTWYVDADGDGYGGTRISTTACTQPSGYVDDSSDCDDNDASSFPGGTEICDGADNDCDGTVDEDDAVDAATWYADTDGDGYGDAGSTTLACSEPSGFVSDGSDCDDGDVSINPGAAEDCTDTVDRDCDGDSGYADEDGDGTAACEDCDDLDASVNPWATEICDAVDNDCDGVTDEADAADASTWYADADADGYGSDLTSTRACLQPSGYVTDATDCDDHDDDVHPYADETCDGEDEDCDGVVDEGASDMATWYADADGDGYGDAGSTTESCSEPSGYVADDTDCDDGDAGINPAASDDCDGVDNDCDGIFDEDAADADTWYIDVDGDGYGSPSYTTTACAEPSGYVADATDCDDLDADVHPGATEICNGEDDDCDGVIDEGATDLATWYADADGDGYGDPSSTTTGCSAPSGYVDDDTDCDDGDASINPGASEVCNGVDDDCDGIADTGTLGSGELCAAESCLEVLGDDPSASDGLYWIVVDGVATEIECDMVTDGGGWTLVFFDDFETSVDPGWSLYSTYTCGGWGNLLGGYGIIAGGSIDIEVDCLGIPHDEAWVDLDYAALDSWDGETAFVYADATTLASWSQNNHSTSYSEVCGWDRGYYGSYDSLHTVSQIFDHTPDTMDLEVGSTLNQAATDESFGIGEVWVWVR